MSTTIQAGPPNGAGLPGTPDLGRKLRLGEATIKASLFASALLSIAITIGIIASLIQPVIEFFSTHVSFSEFFAVTDPSGSSAKPAVIPLLTGTLVTTVIALLVAVPIGLGAAMYLSEYASKRARKWLKPTVELLAGVPSIVYGFFAVTFVTPVVLKGWLNLPVGFFNMLSAGLVLGVMIIPTVASLSEDAMSAVPLALRQGSLAMGANRMQTTLRVVFPAALSGIAAAVVLGISRAVGETMIVVLAAGVAARPDAAGWLVALADMPFIQPDTLHRVAAALRRLRRVGAREQRGVLGRGRAGARPAPRAARPAHRGAGARRAHRALPRG